jgi:hypothetical protein
MERPANVTDLPLERRRLAQPKSGRSQGKSRITNGSSLLGPEADGRSVWARRCRDIIALHTSDLGGADNCSAAELSLIRRIAILSVECERLETKFAQIDDGASPSDKSLDLYARMSGHLRRLLQTLGLGRRARDVTTLGSVLRAGIDRQREHTP